MFGKKSTGAEHLKPPLAHWDPHALALLDRIETRLDRLEALVRDSKAQSAQIQVPPIPGGGVRDFLPLVDRMHEIALVALGHPDLAQSFGLTTRQKESAPQATTEWTEPDEPTPEGTIYG